MKYKKIIALIFVFLFVFLLKINDVSAACSVSISGTKSVVVGNTFKVSATVSSDVGSWYYVLSYDPTKVQLISGSTKVIGVIGDSRTNTYTFKALKSGNANFTATNLSMASNATNEQCSASSGSLSVNMKTQAEIEQSYSKNNNLSSLSVEGAVLSPSFNANTLEYTAKLPPDSTKAKINATAADRYATISGAGDLDVVDGINKIEVIVTSQHGEKKTYIINLTVEELDPIKVKVNGKEYTIVRKKSEIKNPLVGFSESTIKIQNQDIFVYKNDASNITLVSLKDEKGNVNWFVYDEKTKKYTFFDLVISASKNLMILTNNKVPYGFRKEVFKYNDKKVNGYVLKNDNGKKYYLVYAKDLENGKSNYYLYEKNSNVFQIYYDKLISFNDKKIENMKYIIYSLIFLLIIVLLFKVRRKKKINKDDVNISKIDTDYKIRKKSRKQKIKEINAAKERLDNSKPTYKSLFDEEDDL